MTSQMSSFEEAGPSSPDEMLADFGYPSFESHRPPERHKRGASHDRQSNRGRNRNASRVTSWRQEVYSKLPASKAESMDISSDIRQLLRGVQCSDSTCASIWRLSHLLSESNLPTAALNGSSSLDWERLQNASWRLWSGRTIPKARQSPQPAHGSGPLAAAASSKSDASFPFTSRVPFAISSAEKCGSEEEACIGAGEGAGDLELADAPHVFVGPLLVDGQLPDFADLEPHEVCDSGSNLESPSLMEDGSELAQLSALASPSIAWASQEVVPHEQTPPAPSPTPNSGTPLGTSSALSTGSSVLLNAIVGGAVAGLAGRAVSHPFDTIKVLQSAAVQPNASSHHSHTLRQQFHAIMRTGSRWLKDGRKRLATMEVVGPGVRAQPLHDTSQIRRSIRILYRGFTTGTLLSLPVYAAYFTSLEGAQALGRRWEWLTERPTLFFGVTGFITECCVATVWVPYDVVRQRMQLESQRSILDTCRSLMQTSGLRGFFVGTGSYMALWGIFSPVQLATYNKLVQWHLESDAKHGGAPTGRLPLPFYSLYGAASGALAGFVSGPMDLVKTRMQLQTPGVVEYTGMLDGLQQIVRHEGARGLLRASMARTVWSAAIIGTTFPMYELGKRRLHKPESDMHVD